MTDQQLLSPREGAGEVVMRVASKSGRGAIEVLSDGSIKSFPPEEGGGTSCTCFPSTRIPSIPGSRVVGATLRAESSRPPAFQVWYYKPNKLKKGSQPWALLKTPWIECSPEEARGVMSA
eukprot:CAMPEP_0182898184 /NCGR_PEP_ID=MMETSP0034_2-20130328/27339_1 /TAXON_ID=156128 /ORGANISM="Nephroselmis pyriformis, Strain CCMP717" /LENGTH=119 /DNA_ID=CAMNT_0025032143 /DNA_START=59 /DNA_END=415 /DNA_ORIENTATION=+